MSIAVRNGFTIKKDTIIKTNKISAKKAFWYNLEFILQHIFEMGLAGVSSHKFPKCRKSLRDLISRKFNGV